MSETSTPPPQGSALFTREILGQQTDFLCTHRIEGDSIITKIETVLPAMQWDGQCLRTWAPPRFPWSQKGDGR
ncbi:hypothetical protein Ga0100231_024030 [Opitutaceae bacterium TAV4]|nr:hypothetical protein Ga0100231_024030 [Opitutaceae bacterium TAV4]RRK00781.1 hypothetical protein Ga0100230_023605 [Opitutaceae bacterium TAV3]